MKKLILFITSIIFTIDCFASFVYDKGKHAFIFTEDTSLFINMQTDNYNLDGFGYYLNSEFYSISENDLNKALNFKSGDEVRFIKQKTNGAELKTTLYKNRGDESIYKIGGQGNGDIQFIVTPYKISGQPLPQPHLLLYIISGVIGVCIMKRFIKNN